MKTKIEMKNQPLIPVLFFCVCLGLSSCKDDGVEAILPFIGEYSIVSNNHSGLHFIYDDMGGVAGYEERTEILSDSILSIMQIGNTDTVLINGLINTLSGTDYRQEVKATASGDVLNIIYEKSNQTFNNYIRGEIWLEGDSIHLEYNWNRSDIWSTGAIPSYGDVRGRGISL